MSERQLSIFITINSQIEKEMVQMVPSLLNLQSKEMERIKKMARKLSTDFTEIFPSSLIFHKEKI